MTYYPQDSSYVVKNPGVIPSDLDQACSLVGSKPIYIQEAGYQTSSTCGSSPERQAGFVQQLFTDWDKHVSQIPFVCFLRMNDYSAATAQNTANSFGLGNNPQFVGLLQTLGFRTYPTPSSFKSSWSELQNQTHLRGWW